MLRKSTFFPVLLSVASVYFFQSQSAQAAGARYSKNFYTVKSGELYRSAQLTGTEFEQEIEKHGIKTIINLRGAKPGKGWYEDEVKAAEKNNVLLVSIGMSAKRLPHREDLIKLLDTFQTAPRPILIHCQAGADRTGEAVAIYAMEYLKQSKKKAKKHLSWKYFHLKWFTPAKDYFIEKIYMGEQWARAEYDPCKANYKYYNKSSCAAALKAADGENEDEVSSERMELMREMERQELKGDT